MIAAMDTHLPAAPRRATPARRAARTAAALVLATLLAGCGLRLETPPPSEPSLTAAEAARQAVVSDVLDVRATTTVALADAEGRTAEVGATLVTDAGDHLDQLGGVYVSGLVGEDGTPSPVPTGVVAGSTPEALVDLLAQSFSRTRSALETLEDPAFARLTGSVAIAHLASARALAAATGVELPGTGLPTTPVVPVGLEGAPDDDVLALVVAEDSAGYLLEVLSSRLGDAERAAARARAAVHRARAEAWARLAGVDGTAEDPRLVAYALPAGATTDTPERAVVAAVEVALTANLVTLVGRVDAAWRTGVLDLAADSWLAALTWGAAPVAFPGMPEHTPAG